ncbi:hypothetical protein ES708_09549 [subsurface metagenome]
MKTARYLIVALGCLLLLLSSCFLDSPGLNTGGSESVYLPPDQINDSTRSFSEPFEYETLLPVSLNLQIDFYETVFAAEGSSLVEIPPQAGKAIVTLKDSNGNLVYEGGVQTDGTVKAQMAVPAAQENMILTVTAEGYQERSVTIADLVNYTEINRTMGLMYEGVTAKAQVLTDSDGDLVPDVYDAFPFDPDVAFTVRIPDEESLTVAFEDLYLRERAGDADYNDFLAQYTITEYYNGENKLTKIEGEATAKVKIAGYNHMFGISIGYEKDVDASIEATYFDKYGNKQEDVSISPHENITVPANPMFPNKAIIPLFESTEDATKDDIGKTAYFAVTFSEAVEREKVELAPFDPFLYVYNTYYDYDIHLIGKDPLPDTQNPVWSYTTVAFNFMDGDGFPWALLVPTEWQHPAETQFIEELYPFFKDWRESKGASDSNWYLRPLDSKNLPPYLVSGIDANPEYPANTDGLPPYELTIKTFDGKKDPDGDQVFFLSSTLPDKWSLDEDSGELTIGSTPPGELVAYFWSEDEWGASTENNPFKVTFSFVEQGPQTYPRIVIDTYYPDADHYVDTYIDLFDSKGDPDIDDYPWTDDVGDAIASDNNGNKDPGQTYMSRIDYQEGLPSGTYYIRVRANVENTAGWYAIRALSLNIGESLPAYEYPQTPPALPDNTPDGEEDDDDQNANWVMIKSVPIELGSDKFIIRSIDYDLNDLKGDVDWFELILP